MRTSARVEGMPLEWSGSAVPWDWATTEECLAWFADTLTINANIVWRESGA